MNVQDLVVVVFFFSMQRRLEKFLENYSWFQTFAVFWMLYAFFWVIPRHLNIMCRRFGTCSLFHLPAYEDGTDRVRRQGITPKKAYKNLEKFCQPVPYSNRIKKELCEFHV